MKYRIRVNAFTADEQGISLSFDPHRAKCMVGQTYVPFETIKFHFRTTSVLPDLKGQNWVQILSEGKKVYGASAASQTIGIISDAFIDIEGMFFRFHRTPSGKSVEIKGMPLAGLEEIMVVICRNKGPRVMLKYNFSESFQNLGGQYEHS